MAVAWMMSAVGGQEGEEGGWRAGRQHPVMPWQVAARTFIIGLRRAVVLRDPQEGSQIVPAKVALGEGLVAMAMAMAATVTVSLGMTDEPSIAKALLQRRECRLWSMECLCWLQPKLGLALVPGLAAVGVTRAIGGEAPLAGGMIIQGAATVRMISTMIFRSVSGRRVPLQTTRCGANVRANTPHPTHRRTPCVWCVTQRERESARERESETARQREGERARGRESELHASPSADVSRRAGSGFRRVGRRCRKTATARGLGRCAVYLVG